MDMPRAVVAVYASEPDFVNLGILAGVMVAGGAAYIAGHRRPGAKKTVVKDGMKEVSEILYAKHVVQQSPRMQ